MSRYSQSLDIVNRWSRSSSAIDDGVTSAGFVNGMSELIVAVEVAVSTAILAQQDLVLV